MLQASVFLRFLVPGYASSFTTFACGMEGVLNAGVLGESLMMFCTFVSGFNVYHEYRE